MLRSAQHDTMGDFATAVGAQRGEIDAPPWVAIHLILLRPDLSRQRGLTGSLGSICMVRLAETPPWGVSSQAEVGHRQEPERGSARSDRGLQPSLARAI